MKRKKLSCIALLLLMFFAFGIVAESVALAAPIGEWKFDEGSGLLANDSSGQDKKGRLWGAVSWVDGIINKALQFTGSTDYVQVPPSVTGGVGSLRSWTFTAYIKPTGTNDGYIYSERDSEANIYFYISITADNRIKVGTWHKLRAGGWDVYQTATNKITRNEWNNLRITLENGNIAAGSGIAKCYVNGVLAGTGRLGACRSGVPALTNIAGASWKANSGAGLTRLADAINTAAGADYSALYPWNGMTTITQNGRSTVKIPKFYYKRTYDSVNKVHSFWVAKNPEPGFKLHPAFLRNGVEKPYVLIGTNVELELLDWGDGYEWVPRSRAVWRQRAASIGAGWQLWDIQTFSALQMLGLIECASSNISNDSYRGIALRQYTYHSTYGGNYIDGINLKDQRVYIAESNFVDDKYDGQYKDTGFTLPLGSGSTGDWTYSSAYDWLFLPKATGSGGGNFSTSSGNRVAHTYANLFNFYTTLTSSGGDGYTGGHYMYIP